MKELSSFDINTLVTEAHFLVGGKLENVYQLDTKDIYLQLYIKDKPKQLLRILAGKYFYLSSVRPQFPENLQRFCSYLRKYVAGARIKAIDQIGHERIVKFTLDTKDSSYDLFIEFFGKGNAILVRDGKIISVAEEQIWADRVLKGGEVYTYPQREDSKAQFERYKEKGSAVSMKSLDEELSKELLLSQKKATVKEKEMQKIRVIIEKQEQQLNKVISESEENKKKGELLYQEYEKIQDLMKTAQSLKGKSEQEIEKVLSKHKAFKKYLPKEHVVVVDIK